MNKLITDVDLTDEKERAKYFHDMSEDSRQLELLLNTCYSNNIVPAIASNGSSKKRIAYISLKIEKNNLNSIGKLIDLVTEIPNSEFTFKSEDGMYAELSCESSDSEQLFTRMKEIIEENVLDSNHTYNFTVMSTIYNISKILREVADASIVFATNKKLYEQGKCGLSIYKDRQKSKINIKKKDTIDEIMNNIKTKATLNLPTVFFCTFEELRNFYFELDEAVYSNDIEGEIDGQ